MKNLLKKSKQASFSFANTSFNQRKKILQDLALALKNNIPQILKENQKDLIQMDKNDPLYDRLMLNPERIEDMAQACLTISKQEDVLNQVLEERILESKIELKKITVPMGVIACIYEARPNVTIDIAALCLFTGNTVVLRGSSSAQYSNKILVKIIHKVLSKNQIDPAIVAQFSLDRNDLKTLFQATEYVDLLIPRGGQNLINRVRQESLVPTIETGAGVCHTFVDQSADLNQAVKIIINAKTQRPAVCNALDCIIAHQDLPEEFFKNLLTELEKFKVKIYADSSSFSKFPINQLVNKITEENKVFGQEFLGLALSIKTVSNTTAAINHINTFGSRHSEAILSQDKNNITEFFQMIDASSVYANASTRYTDGGCFGLGAEIGISTQKLHARGPMGASTLTSYKYILKGQGQVR